MDMGISRRLIAGWAEMPNLVAMDGAGIPDPYQATGGEDRRRSSRACLARGMHRVIRRRLTARAYGLMLLCLLLMGVYVLLSSPVLHLQKVQVIGTSPQIFADTGILMGTPMYALNLRLGRTRLLAADPALASAELYSRWPDTVTVVVHMRHAVGLLLEANGQAFGVDGTGRVLPLSASPPDLPYLTGVPQFGLLPYSWLQGTAVQGASVLQDLGALQPQVSEVHVGSGGVDLVLTSGVVVQLGTGSMPQKLGELTVILSNFARRGLVPRTVNLSVLGHPSVVF